MRYSDIVKKIEEIENSDFTLESLNNIGIIVQKINSIYSDELIENKLDARTNFIAIRGMISNLVFEKLKEKLDFEDEVIYKILGFIDSFYSISDIYVVDGNVIIKMLSPNKYKKISYLISPKFYDVASKKFVEDLDYSVYKGFFIDAMNKAMIPTFKEPLGKSNLLSIDNNQIGYNLDDLNIYIDRPLKEIMQINTDVTKEAIKVIIRHHDEVYYYDLKVHYAYLELAHNEYKINKLSEMLDKTVKTKTLKNG